MATMQGLADRVNRLFSDRRFPLIVFVVITLMVLLAYSNTFTASFHFDDTHAIEDNASIKRMTADNIWRNIAGNRPVVALISMLNYQLSGLNVIGWHLFNISLHIVNSFFVYLFMLHTLNRSAETKHYGDRAKRVAFFGALLFAVHPIQTESVTYIISRTELLATFFYLATFLLFIQGSKTKGMNYSIGIFLTSLLAMGSKEWAVTLPAMLLLYDYLFLSGQNIKTIATRWKTYVLAALPWVLIWHSLDLTSKGGSAGVGFNLVSTTGITPWTYLLTSLNVLWTYIRLLILPINQNLDYDYPVAKALLEFPTILSLLGHIAVVSGAFWLYKKKGWLLIPFAVAWFYISLSPVQSFVPVIDVIFEHRVYMPSIGFFLAFIVAFEQLLEWLEKRKTTAVPS